MFALLTGRLISEPQAREVQKTGGTMTTAVIATKLDSRSEDDAGDFVASIVAFGEPGERLALLSKGSTVSVSGRVQVSTWNNERRFTVLADSVASARASQAADRARRASHD